MELEKEESTSTLAGVRSSLEETKTQLNAAQQELEAERKARAVESQDLSQKLEKASTEKQALQQELDTKVRFCVCSMPVGLYLSQADKASKEVYGMQQGYIGHQGEILCLQHMRKSARLAW